jgi:hypothetical protein
MGSETVPSTSKILRIRRLTLLLLQLLPIWDILAQPEEQGILTDRLEAWIQIGSARVGLINGPGADWISFGSADQN